MPVMQHLDNDTIRCFIRGGLDSKASGAARKHLAECSHCRRVVDDERRLHDALELDDAPPASPAALDRLMDRVEELSPRLRARRRRKRVMVAVAGITIAVCGMALLYAARPRPGEHERIAAELGLSIPLQASVVASLDPLAVLRDDPWIADQLDTYEQIQKLTLADEK